MGFTGLYTCKPHGWTSPVEVCPHCSPHSLTYQDTVNSNSRNGATLSYAVNSWFKLDGVVEINTLTGEIILYKAPNEAALQFWQEVRKIAY